MGVSWKHQTIIVEHDFEEVTTMLALFSFLASPAGRAIRIIAGLVLILAGFWWITGIVGWIVALIGLVPLAAGVFDWCVFAPLFGMPFLGPYLRRYLEGEQQT
jgi:hypothetical protein